jgi:hypothetical protein
MNFLPAGLKDFFEKTAIKEVRLSNPYSRGALDVVCRAHFNHKRDKFAEKKRPKFGPHFSKATA